MWDKEDPKKDAKKAMWYLNRLIQKLEDWKLSIVIVVIFFIVPLAHHC
jgi:hypothetical protein